FDDEMRRLITLTLYFNSFYSFLEWIPKQLPLYAHAKNLWKVTWVYFQCSDAYRYRVLTDGLNYNAKKSRDKSQNCQFRVIKKFYIM
ncbi:hypothetical protein, partial [Vibrio sp. 2132-1]|uniref:hypothetical protein n=1 Tax=Vibrio sp. 2132-1 TaxID=3074598 RepID=UPI00296647E4